MTKSRHVTMALGLIGLVSFLSLFQGEHACANDITDSVNRALQTSPDIDIVKADRRAVDQELRQAQAGYLPSIDLRGAIGPEYAETPTTRDIDGDTDWEVARDVEIRLRQMLFDGFGTENEVARQRARVDSAAYRVEETAEFVALDAIQAHLEVLRTQAIVRLSEDNVAQHEEILDQVSRLEARGVTNIADVRQAQSRLESARAALATSEGARADAHARYERVVGISPEALLDVTPPVALLPEDREEAASIASVSSPSVSIAAADEGASAAELLVTRSSYYPRLDAELSAGRGFDQGGLEGSSESAAAQLVMTYNLYRGGADLAREREALQRINEARATLMRVRRDAEEDARISYNALTTARAETVALSDKAVAQTGVRDAYRQQFDIGDRDLLDVLDAENELFLDLVKRTTAEFTEKFATYRVFAVTGTLLDVLDVKGPPEQRNDHRGPEPDLTAQEIEARSTIDWNANTNPFFPRGRPEDR